MFYLWEQRWGSVYYHFSPAWAWLSPDNTETAWRASGAPKSNTEYQQEIWKCRSTRNAYQNAIRRREWGAAAAGTGSSRPAAQAVQKNKDICVAQSIRNTNLSRHINTIPEYRVWSMLESTSFIHLYNELQVLTSRALKSLTAGGGGLRRLWAPFCGCSFISFQKQVSLCDIRNQKQIKHSHGDQDLFYKHSKLFISIQTQKLSSTKFICLISCFWTWFKMVN